MELNRKRDRIAIDRNFLTINPGKELTKLYNLISKSAG